MDVWFRSKILHGREIDGFIPLSNKVKFTRGNPKKWVKFPLRVRFFHRLKFHPLVIFWGFLCTQLILYGQHWCYSMVDWSLATHLSVLLVLHKQAKLSVKEAVFLVFPFCMRWILRALCVHPFTTRKGTRFPPFVYGSCFCVRKRRHVVSLEHPIPPANRAVGEF